MKPDKGNNKRNTFGLITLILWALVLTFLFRSCSSSYASANEVQVDYSTFKEWVQQDKVDRVLMQSGKYTITLKEGVTVEVPEQNSSTSSIFYNWMGNQDRETVYVTTPTPVADLELYSLMESHGVDYYDKPVDSSTQIMYLLLSYLLPVVIMVGAMMFLFRGVGGKGGMGGLGGVGKANAKVYVEKKTGVTFRDVAGQDEAKESLQEIIDILHNPQKYTDIGAKLPKGVLLVGPPGTGKTLLAKAVAGEAGVPFFSISGSDFVEMFVGVGASRVRDLFKQAQQSAPCIIFIDEIDAIGRSRDSRFGGNDEREQTLNQLLSEMDGFDSSKGLLVLGATNRPEILDPALLRPGRFDRRVIVDKPDLKGRVSILKVHSKDVRLDETVDFEEIALATSGAVGADLANMMNEAAINAVKNGRQAVSQKDLFEAVELVLVGKEKKDRILSKEERRIVSYHEVGHALVTALQKDAEPVQKITIVPRTMGALGYVMQVPEEEKFLNTKKELKAMLVVSLAGRAAEEIVFDTVTTGAANDIEQATRVARAMVTQYGMSDKFGLMGLETQENQYLTGRTVMNCGDATAAEIDTEVMKMLKEAYAEAKRLLSENRDAMDKIAAFLIEKETITGKEFMKIFREVKGIPEPEEGQKDDHSRMGGESAETVESAENGNRQPEMAAGSEQLAAEQVQNPVQDGNSVMPQDPEQKTAETQNGQQGSDNGQGPAEL